jgi:N-acetylmuramoyl-L-alanine amidase
VGRRLGFVLAAVAFVIAGTGQVLAVVTKPVITDARIGVNGAQTRFVLNISDGVDIKVFTLADPYRLVLDLPEVDWKLPGKRPYASGSLIKGYRYGPFRLGRARMVLDLSGPVTVANNFTLPPEGERRYRFVLDLAAAEDAEFRKTAGWPEGEQPSDTGAELAQDSQKPQNAKRIVCIDPGHGGVDPGATGVAGSLEKDVVLAAAKKVRDALKRNRKYTIAMTRDSDVFLSLKARVAVCRQAKASLMISFHADSVASSHDIRGATVYTLSEKASDKEAEELANSENQSDIIAGVDLSKEPDIVTNILIDLAQRETKNNSVRFARTLVPELERTGRVVAKSHKFAGFRVLKAPDVPSVLIELGYLTNASDESQLRSETWRAQLAQAVVRAVERYFRAEKSANGISP